MSRAEIRIRWSLGDTVNLAEYLRHAVTSGEWSVLKTWWWLARETRRRGLWRPTTVGDYVRLRRMRAYLRQPRQGRRPVPWRHYAQERPEVGRR